MHCVDYIACILATLNKMLALTFNLVNGEVGYLDILIN